MHNFTNVSSNYYEIYISTIIRETDEMARIMKTALFKLSSEI